MWSSHRVLSGSRITGQTRKLACHRGSNTDTQGRTSLSSWRIDLGPGTSRDYGQLLAKGQRLVRVNAWASALMTSVNCWLQMAINRILTQDRCFQSHSSNLRASSHQNGAPKCICVHFLNCRWTCCPCKMNVGASEMSVTPQMHLANIAHLGPPRCMLPQCHAVWYSVCKKCCACTTVSVFQYILQPIQMNVLTNWAPWESAAITRECMCSSVNWPLLQTNSEMDKQLYV